MRIIIRQTIKLYYILLRFYVLHNQIGLLSDCDYCQPIVYHSSLAIHNFCSSYQLGFITIRIKCFKPSTMYMIIPRVDQALLKLNLLHVSLDCVVPTDTCSFQLSPTNQRVSSKISIVLHNMPLQVHLILSRLAPGNAQFSNSKP